MKLNCEWIFRLLLCVALVCFALYIITEYSLFGVIAGVCLFSGTLVKFLSDKITARKEKKNRSN